MSTSTIFARASGAGRAGVAVFRLSGPQAGEALVSLTGSRGEPRYARRVTVRDQGGVIDDGLALWFPAPHSFTGEDVVELHLHGSLAVEARLDEALLALGLEHAGPGAFTMRAFAQGKLDLTQTEGLRDLLEAETTLQHKQALRHMRGELRGLADQWRKDLVEAMAMLDAAVDFPDEHDVPGGIAEQALPAVERVRASLTDAMAGAVKARHVREGFRVAIIGPPNAGKSTLFNQIVESERAIVSPEAGTTRDAITERLEIGGHLVTLIDTAGIRESTTSSIEGEGVKRAEEAARLADLRLLAWPSDGGPVADWLAALGEDGDLHLATKADLAAPRQGVLALPRQGALAVSATDSATIERLLRRLKKRLDERAAPGLAPSKRQQTLLTAAIDDLSRFQAGDTAPEVLSEILRAAARHLEVLTGRIAPDDILDDIFSSFCIGK
ncbi:MAG: tRNA uridine-5-carboxymethylaminomethyl(34) synthesis GTPase MnmE [Pseudomonadota bacterium]